MGRFAAEVPSTCTHQHLRRGVDPHGTQANWPWLWNAAVALVEHLLPVRHVPLLGWYCDPCSDINSKAANVCTRVLSTCALLKLQVCAWGHLLMVVNVHILLRTW